MHILPKHPHITKPTHTHTHTNTHILQNKLKQPQYKINTHTHIRKHRGKSWKKIFYLFQYDSLLKIELFKLYFNKHSHWCLCFKCEDGDKFASKYWLAVFCWRALCHIHEEPQNSFESLFKRSYPIYLTFRHRASSI